MLFTVKSFPVDGGNGTRNFLKYSNSFYQDIGSLKYKIHSFVFNYIYIVNELCSNKMFFLAYTENHMLL